MTNHQSISDKTYKFYCDMFRVFDALCPMESSKARKRLCVILFCRDTPEQEELRDSMRHFVMSHTFSPDRVKFTYLFLERQPGFISAVSKVRIFNRIVRVNLLFWNCICIASRFTFIQNPGWEIIVILNSRFKLRPTRCCKIKMNNGGLQTFVCINL